MEVTGRLIHSIQGQRYKRKLPFSCSLIDDMIKVWWDESVSKWYEMEIDDWALRENSTGFHKTLRPAVQWCLKKYGPNNFDLTPTHIRYADDKDRPINFHFRNKSDAIHFKMIWMGGYE